MCQERVYGGDLEPVALAPVLMLSLPPQRGVRSRLGAVWAAHCAALPMMLQCWWMSVYMICQPHVALSPM